MRAVCVRKIHPAKNLAHVYYARSYQKNAVRFTGSRFAVRRQEPWIALCRNFLVRYDNSKDPGGKQYQQRAALWFTSPILTLSKKSFNVLSGWTELLRSVSTRSCQRPTVSPKTIEVTFLVGDLPSAAGAAAASGNQTSLRFGWYILYIWSIVAFLDAKDFIQMVSTRRSFLRCANS